MKPMCKSVGLLTIVLFAAVLAGGQCVGCKQGNCTVSNAGGCLCTMGGGICLTCGACTYGDCIVPCKTNPNVSSGVAPTVRNEPRTDRPTIEQLSLHPWINDDVLPLTIAKHSEVLGRLIGKEQQILRTRWCTSFVRGNVTINAGAEPTIYKWELIFRDGVDELRAKRLSDTGDEQGIIITPTRWILYSGDDFANVVVQGAIDEPHTRD